MEINEGYFVEVSSDSTKGKKNYYTTDSTLKIKDKVIIETLFGLELGEIMSIPKKESENNFTEVNLTILRKATEEDYKSYCKNKEETTNANIVFKRSVEKLNLDMKLVSSIYTLDRSKILFTYVSDERVDFRDLLKELSNNFKCRIELKQIGNRDRSKSIGGLGICGLPLCCSSFLNEFEGISINMAKNQFLALNIQKLSGQCGKLLCCLKYEDDTYSELKLNAPKLGQKFNYEGKQFKVVSLNLLSSQARIESFDKEVSKNLSIKELKTLIEKGK